MKFVQGWGCGDREEGSLACSGLACDMLACGVTL